MFEFQQEKTEKKKEVLALLELESVKSTRAFSSGKTLKMLHV